MATDREIAPIHKPAAAVDDQANAQAQAGQTDRNTANAGDKPGTGRLPEVVEGMPAADAFRQQVGFDAPVPDAKMRGEVIAQFARASTPTPIAKEAVFKNPDGSGNLTGVTTTNRDGTVSFVTVKPGEKPVIYEVQGTGPNARLQLQTMENFGTRNRSVPPGESDNKAAVPSAMFKTPGDTLTGANIRENLTRTAVQPAVQPTAEVANTRSVVPPAKANEVQTPAVTPGQLPQMSQPLTINQANQPGVLAGRSEFKTDTISGAPFKLPDVVANNPNVQNSFNPATHRQGDAINLNPGAPVKPNVDVNTGQPVKPNVDLNVGQPVKPNVDINAGQPFKPNVDINAGQPFKPNVDMNAGQPFKPNVDINAGQPFKPNIDINAMLPAKGNVDVSFKPGDLPQVRVGDLSPFKPGDSPGIRQDLSQMLRNPGDMQANLQNIALILAMRSQEGRAPGITGDTTIKPAQALEELALRLKDMNMTLKPGDKPGAEFVVRFEGTRSEIGKGLPDLGARFGADGKLEIKTDSKAENKVDSKDAKPENIVTKREIEEQKSGIKSDLKADSKLDGSLDNKDIKLESKIDTKNDPKLDSATESKLDSKIGVKVDIKTETKAESEVKNENKSGSKPDIKPDSDQHTESKSDRRPESIADKIGRPDKQEPGERPELHVPNSFEIDHEGVKSETPIADGRQSDRTEGKLPDEKEKGREAEEREEEDRVRNAAIAALIAVKKKQQQEEKENLLQNDKSKKDEDKRRRYVVKEKDTLETIAKKQLRDIRLAALIYEINKHMLPVRLEKGKQIIEPRPGSSIWLPSESEIKEFRSRLYAAPKSGSSILQQSNALKTKQSAEEELDSRFGDNWDGSAKISAGMLGAAVAKNQNRRANIEKILGPMGTKPTDSLRIRYIVRLSDTLDGVAAKHPAIKDAEMWPLIARLNQLSEDEDEDGKPLAELRRGMVLTLPLPQEIELYKNPPLDFSADAESDDISDEESRPELTGATNSGDSITTILSRSNTVSMSPVVDDEQLTVVLPQANVPTINLEPVKKTPVIPAPMPLASPSLSAPASPPAALPTPSVTSTPAPVAPVEPRPKEVATSDVLPAVPTRPMQPVVSLLGPPQNVGGRLIWNLDASVRLVKSSINWDSTIGVYRSQLELLLSGTWYPVVFYEVMADSSTRHEFAPGNRKRSVRIDLPPVAVQEMSDNDLLANWRGYCQRYVSQLPPA